MSLLGFEPRTPALSERCATWLRYKLGNIILEKKSFISVCKINNKTLKTNFLILLTWELQNT